MKAIIEASTGILHIKAETELEAYALNRWVKDNIHECTGEINKESMGFDWSLIPYCIKKGSIYKIEHIDFETVKLTEQ